jgi:polar amino acid transport system permease protein
MWTRIAEYLPELLPAALRTVVLTVVSMAFATLLGAVMAALGYSRSRAVRWATRLYVETSRNTPELVQIYLWFFVLPTVGIVLPPDVAGVIALSWAFGAYLTEVVRGGIEAVETDQWEAAQVLGMPRRLTWRRVILPQAARNVLPVWASYFVSMFKATAFLSVITVPELLYVTHEIASINFRYFELFALAGILYFLMGYPSLLAFERLERRWGRAVRPEEQARTQPMASV